MVWNHPNDNQIPGHQHTQFSNHGTNAPTHARTHTQPTQPPQPPTHPQYPSPHPSHIPNQPPAALPVPQPVFNTRPHQPSPAPHPRPAFPPPRRSRAGLAQVLQQHQRFIRNGVVPRTLRPGYGEAGPAPRTPPPRSPAQPFIRTPVLPGSPTQTPLPFTNSPQSPRRQFRGFADDWLAALENDLAEIPVPQNLTGEAEEYLPEISDVGAYLPQHHVHQLRADGAGPSNASNPLNQLHGAQVAQRQTSTRWVDNGLVPDDERVQQPPLSLGEHPQQRSMLQQQQNPYIQEQVARSAEYNPVAATDHPTPGALPIREGAITRPPHRRGHRRGVGLFRCEECPEMFENRVNMLRHLRSCHKEEKNAFPCAHCSASYEGAGARTAHMKKAHPDTMPQFPDVEPLLTIVHGKTRFVCGIEGCSKDYASMNNVNRHFEMHHANIRYPCECGHQATTRANLKAHRTSCPLHRRR